MILPSVLNVVAGLLSATAGMEDLLAVAVIRGVNIPGLYDEVKGEDNNGV